MKQKILLIFITFFVLFGATMVDTQKDIEDDYYCATVDNSETCVYIGA